MTPGSIAVAAWAAVVAVSLLSIVGFFLLWAAVSVLTVVKGRHRARARSREFAELSRDCAVSDLAEIDEALRRVLAEEHWRPPSRASR